MRTHNTAENTQRLAIRPSASAKVKAYPGRNVRFNSSRRIAYNRFTTSNRSQTLHKNSQTHLKRFERLKTL